MAIVFMTGFDWTSDVKEFPFLSSIDKLSLTTGRYSYGKCLQQLNPSSPVGKVDFGARYTELYMELDLRVKAFSTSNSGTILVVYSEDLVDHFYIRMTDADASGNINIKFVDAGGTIIGSATTSNPVLANSWVHIGIYVKVHATAGAVTVRVDSGSGPVTVISATGVDTEYLVGKGMQYLSILMPNWGSDMCMDNLVVMDTTGTKDIAFKGPSRIYTAHPNAVGNYSQFTPKSGSNYQNVDDTDPDEDSTYNESSTSGNRDSFPVPTWVGILDPALTIAAVKVTALARKTDATAISLFVSCRQGSVDYDGSSVALGDVYQNPGLVTPEKRWDQDPNVAADWTITRLDTAEWGYGIP